MKYTREISTIILLIFIIYGCKGANKSINKQKRKPNIVLIIADDLGYSDVNYMHQKSEIQTPNIDQLAKRGIVFSDAYAACPVCSPTRASLMTGKYPASLKITCHIPGMGMDKYLAKLNKGKKLKEAFFLDHLPNEEVTIAEVLKEQGYATGYLGKWHLGGEGSIYTKDGIVNRAYNPDAQGFDVNIGGCAYGQPASYFSPYRNGTIPDGPDGEYLTDRLGDEAVKFIEEKKDQPFYLNLATYTVHTPLAAPTEYVEKYGGNKYFAMIEKLDQNVGKVMDKLKELDLLENTIVIFYSDNGGLWGNPPLKGKKGTLNEGGIRVPLIFRWDNNIKAGTTCDKPVTTVDFFPTMLDAVGVSPSDYPQLEGLSLLSLLKGKNKFPERSIYWHFPHHRKEGLSMGAAVRNGKWKYIYGFESEKEYLYNLEEDITEQFNLMEKYPKKAKELSSDLREWQAKVGAEMPEINTAN
ncbi:sulfatase [Labilibaculum antarcticum]|uniref:Sulfatase N-terminal domain-containing protein n=1 Tax=Labilibaculum antarcticum TaxID=1717717 RepID=A0A1Y1CER4_9BACT|nr:sulfatase [Labilibaculum antarcticum]BAX78814.1 hypothetical protein ALGA_0420 [Labilibaculum antarcticum]